MPIPRVSGAPCPLPRATFTVRSPAHSPVRTRVPLPARLLARKLVLTHVRMRAPLPARLLARLRAPLPVPSTAPPLARSSVRFLTPALVRK